jgi:hypothetical protein
VLNFLFYQAGVDIWGKDEQGGPPLLDDQLVEVVGIQGLLHEAQIRASLGTGIQLGRGKCVQFHMNKRPPTATAVRLSTYFTYISVRWRATVARASCDNNISLW